MRIEGNLYIGNRLICQYTAACDDERPFNKKMEFCLLKICRELALPLPLWMGKNTRELGAFHQTTFTPEQFIDKVYCDRFVLKWLD